MKFDLSHIEFSHHDLKRGIKLPEKPSEELAELVGIVLGDGNVYSYVKGKKIKSYAIRIAGDSRYNYLTHYVTRLCKHLFNIIPSYHKLKNREVEYLLICGKIFIDFMGIMNLKSGNKIKNQSTIPQWVWQKEKYIKSCIRGLMDTDGSIYELLPHWPGLFQLTFENHNFTLLNDTRKAFIKLGFIPSKLSGSKKRGKTKFYLTKKAQIEKYLKEVGFSNTKHIERLKNYQSSVV